MLVIITNQGEFQTTDKPNEVREKFQNLWNTRTISFTGSTDSIKIDEDTIQPVTETITLMTDGLVCIGFRQYENKGGMEKSEPLHPKDEVQLLAKEIADKQERKSNLEKALKHPDYVAYLEHRIKADEHIKKYSQEKSMEIAQLQKK